MDNLRRAIKAIFSNNSIDRVLESISTPPFKSITEQYPLALFLENAGTYFSHYSLNEITNVFSKLEEDWFFDAYSSNRNSRSIFNLLIHFNKQVITENSSEPFIQYKHLLRWREMSFDLGEDIFTISYFAFMDNRSGRKRDFFSWRAVAFTTNNRLKGILNKGIAENHFHLKGSGPVFDIAWISLMNSICGRKQEFLKLKKESRLFPINEISFTGTGIDIEVLIYKAAYIRSTLFNVLNNNNTGLNHEYLKYCSSLNESFELVLDLNKIQCDISASKELYGYKFKFKDSSVVADYAITSDIHEYNFQGCILLSGERKFLYDCFTAIFSGDELFDKLKDAFFSYLLIKNNLRKELIQINTKIGFANFSAYQDRKELFIQPDSIYEYALLNLAITDTLRFQNITHFETRLTPKAPSSELDNSLNKIENITSKKSTFNNNGEPHLRSTSKFNHTNHFYTLHFIKQKDSLAEKIGYNQSMVTARHALLRSEIREQARAIVEIREGASENASKIRGIDAASSEFDARPEVFAQAFRYLKDHKLSGRYNWLKEDLSEYKLMATFHAGEDFYDIVDGLRTIDEAIKFLNLGQGDRLGHALALGIDVPDFYSLKNRKIMLPKQILLDNVAWLLGQLERFGITSYLSEISRLKNYYDNLFREIFARHCRVPEFSNTYFSHELYYESWKLRGDDPYLYLNGWTNDVLKAKNLTYWDRCRINYSYPLQAGIRNSSEAKFLYQEYHFNPSVKSTGSQIKQFDVSPEYVLLVQLLQTHYQKVISKKNIGIECNPTSNYLIGTFKRYSKHPIIKFNNIGLTNDSNQIKDCAQLFVSINTDDQGIFGTSLENEYALMAIALEKEKDENGHPVYNPTMIYNWLDNIRKMGIEQSFSPTRFHNKGISSQD